MADGGDGSLTVIAAHLNLKKQYLETTDALGKNIVSSFCTYPDAISRQTSAGRSYFELAETSGLAKLSPIERNPLNTTTYGTGKLMQKARHLGFYKQHLFLGGSSTHDLGLGIAAGVGFQFLDKNNKNFIPTGGTLNKIKKIVPPSHSQISKQEINLICDVKNPLTGPEGAAMTYAFQKGADLPMAKKLEADTKYAADLLSEYCGRDISQFPGSGAAGGIPAGLSALLNAKILPGFDFIADITHLEDHIKEADIVISGEGRLDRQSLQGKVPSGVAKLCQKWNKPLILVTGQNTLGDEATSLFGSREVHSILDLANSVEDAMDNAETYLEEIGAGLLG